jgi:lysophospholipase L1-like esterase
MKGLSGMEGVGMVRARGLVAALAASALLALVAPLQASAAPPPLPSSMASTGDSITRAFDVGWCCILRDNPQYSWSTGDNTSVLSQYQRVLAANPAISGHEFNDAHTGAVMADLDGQVKTAAGQGVQYLTILMGANDVCTKTIASMTPTATYKAEFTTALTDFTTQDPTALVFLASIPNVFQLWALLHTNPKAEKRWSFFGICQSMLNPNNTDAQRAQVLAQVQADNAALKAVCAQFTACHFDGNAVFNFKLKTADVSTVDFFHPSFTGQNQLAAVTWGASYWPGTP